MKVLDNVLKTFAEADAPIDIKNIAESLGAKIIKKDLGKVDGVLFQGCIGVNSKLCPYSQRFVIAHELCHFLLGEKGFSKGIYHSKDFKEVRADDFATKILLPAKKLEEIYKEYQNIPTIASYFGVPEKVVEKRLNNIYGNY